MPENFITLPDGKKYLVYSTNQHPDFATQEINIQETLRADIPTYLVVADNVAVSVNANLLAIFNNINPGKRIRIQKIKAYVRTTANNNVILQIGYINATPTGGTDALFNKLSADFPSNQASPNGVISKVLSTGPTPLAGINLGGSIIPMNSDLRKHTIFEVEGNGSALQLRAGSDGIVIRDVAQTGTGGNLTLEVTLTLD